MATRLGGGRSSSDPTGNAHVVVTDLGVSQSTPIRLHAGPKPFTCTAPMEVGLRLLKLSSVGPQYPSGLSFSQAT